MAANRNNLEGFIPQHGGYRKLITYQKSEIVYDGTVYFTKRFFQKYDRTIDQMVQAARSGKQNIAEASMASATSKETEIKLTNVARGSPKNGKDAFIIRYRQVDLFIIVTENSKRVLRILAAVKS